jgi:hypothetical protein
MIHRFDSVGRGLFNVCPRCGEYSDDKTVDVQRAVAICKHCKHEHQFRLLPLFVVTGASCTGKSTVSLQIADKLPECVALEGDILWRDEFNKPQAEYMDFRNVWLRMCKNIAQSGRPVVLFGSVAPGQFEQCPERRYIGDIHYLAYVCRPDILRCRLLARPAWRGSGDSENVERMLSFNDWLLKRQKIAADLDVLDTSDISEGAAAKSTADWVRKRL